jgi:hypothetical protein
MCVIGCFILLLGVLACDSEPGGGPADLVIRGGRILTLDSSIPEAEALAVRGNTILALGTEAEMATYVGTGSQVIELEAENLVLPGFIDAHGHFMSLGESLMQLDLRSPRSWDEIVTLVEAAVAEAEPGGWIVGRGWHQDKWDFPPVPAVEGLPTHHSLSAVTPDNPVMLIHVSGHGVFVNSRALEIMDVSASMRRPRCQGRRGGNAGGDHRTVMLPYALGWARSGGPVQVGVHPAGALQSEDRAPRSRP